MMAKIKHTLPPALRATPVRKGLRFSSLSPCGRGCPEGAGEGSQP